MRNTGWRTGENHLARRRDGSGRPREDSPRTFQSYPRYPGKSKIRRGNCGERGYEGGGNGCYAADFHSNGLIAIGIAGRAAKNKPAWNDLIWGHTPKSVNGFYPFGFAAVGDSLVCEINGVKCTARDSHITFGFLGLIIGHDSEGFALFKDIEVFVPDKDSPAKPAAAKGPAIREKPARQSVKSRLPSPSSRGSKVSNDLPGSRQSVKLGFESPPLG